MGVNGSFGIYRQGVKEAYVIGDCTYTLAMTLLSSLVFELTSKQVHLHLRVSFELQM